MKFNRWQSTDGVTRNSVLQVVSSGEINNVTSSTSTGYADATGMSLAITPTSATSKILVRFDVGIRIGAGATSAYMALRILRDGVAIFDPYTDNGTGHYAYGPATGGASSVLIRTAIPLTYLDSPATTNEVTYKLQFRNYVINSSQIAYINEGPKSSITLMEIAQ